MSLPLPARLAALRTVAGLNAAELGELAGLSRATVSLLETGARTEPSVTTITRIAEALGDDEGWLIAGVGEPPSKEKIDAAVAKAREARAKKGAA